MTGSLDMLKLAESEARHEIEEARRKAALTRASIPGDIASLKEEKSRRVSLETRRRGAVVQAEAGKIEEALLLKAGQTMDYLQSLEDGLTGRAFDLLRKTLSERAE